MRLGRQFTKVPDTVNQVRSGGMGHLEGDDSRSVVAMLPVHSLLPFRDVNRRGEHAHPGSAETINSIAQDIKSGKGIENPIMIAYDHDAKWGFIGEGHHRLEAAIQAGATHVPATIYRQRGDMSERRRQRRGSHLAMVTDFGSDRSAGWQDGKYVPSNIHPYHFKQFM